MNNIFGDTFLPTKYLYNGGNSQGLRKELEQFNLKELMKIYYTISGWKLDKEIRNNKNLLIDTIVHKALYACNRAVVFRDTKEYPVYK